MKIKAEKIRGEDLKPGDLFSTANQQYWNNIHPASIGEKVYIRTDTVLTPEQEQEEEEIYRITILLEVKDND